MSQHRCRTPLWIILLFAALAIVAVGDGLVIMWKQAHPNWENPVLVSFMSGLTAGLVVFCIYPALATSGSWFERTRWFWGMLLASALLAVVILIDKWLLVLVIPQTSISENVRSAFVVGTLVTVFLNIILFELELRDRERFINTVKKRWPPEPPATAPEHPGEDTAGWRVRETKTTGPKAD